MIVNKAVAIIPARGGSKRIPKKNIKLFAGRPIISYSIRAAREAGLFDRIIVSTDSSEIANVARQHGAEVPYLRPMELANDIVGTAEVVIHAIEWLAAENRAPKFVCCMYATAPFIQFNYLKEGYDKLVSSEATSVFSVTTYPYPIYRSLKINEKGCIEMVWPAYEKYRSQDLPKAYHDAGQFYWINTKKFVKAKTLFADDSLPVVLPRYLVQDIDTAEDWETAEHMFERMQIRKRLNSE